MADRIPKGGKKFKVLRYRTGKSDWVETQIFCSSLSRGLRILHSLLYVCYCFSKIAFYLLASHIENGYENQDGELFVAL
jgi:hypothetical protein